MAEGGRDWPPTSIVILSVSVCVAEMLSFFAVLRLRKRLASKTAAARGLAVSFCGVPRRFASFRVVSRRFASFRVVSRCFASSCDVGESQWLRVARSG